MLYVLDTNILSALRFEPNLVSAPEVATTAFNLEEILYGATRKPGRADLQAFARFVIENIPIFRILRTQRPGTPRFASSGTWYGPTSTR